MGRSSRYPSRVTSEVHLSKLPVLNLFSAYILKLPMGPWTRFSTAEGLPFSSGPSGLGVEASSCLVSTNSGAPKKETPIACYHEQSNAPQAVAFLPIGCSKCGISRDRSYGPDVLALFAGLPWMKFWPFRGARPPTWTRVERKPSLSSLCAHIPSGCRQGGGKVGLLLSRGPGRCLSGRSG